MFIGSLSIFCSKVLKQFMYQNKVYNNVSTLLCIEILIDSKVVSNIY